MTNTDLGIVSVKISERGFVTVGDEQIAVPEQRILRVTNDKDTAPLFLLSDLPVPSYGKGGDHRPRFKPYARRDNFFAIQSQGSRRQTLIVSRHPEFYKMLRSGVPTEVSLKIFKREIYDQLDSFVRYHCKMLENNKLLDHDIPLDPDLPQGEQYLDYRDYWCNKFVKEWFFDSPGYIAAREAVLKRSNENAEDTGVEAEPEMILIENQLV